MEKINAEITVTDNMIEINPEDGFQDDYIYEIRLKNIKELNGSRVIEPVTLKFITKPKPCYSDISSVLSLLEQCNIPEEAILYHLRESSKFVDYITGMTSRSTIPFEVTQFVKYKSAHQCLLRFYIEKAANSGSKGQMGDVIFDNTTKSPDISELLKITASEADYWLDAVLGHKVTGRAKPVTAVRGSNPDTSKQVMDNPPQRSYT